jgi:hypothetical protein
MRWLPSLLARFARSVAAVPAALPPFRIRLILSRLLAGKTAAGGVVLATNWWLHASFAVAWPGRVEG